MEEQALRKVIRKLIKESVASIDMGIYKKLQSLATADERQAIELGFGMGDEYITQLCMSQKYNFKKSLLEKSIESKLPYGRISDCFVMPGDYAELSWTYNDYRDDSDGDLNRIIKIRSDLSGDPSSWTMAITNVNIKQYKRTWDRFGNKQGIWTSKMPSSHSFVGESIPCSVEKMIAIFQEFKELCDEIDPDRIK